MSNDARCGSEATPEESDVEKTLELEVPLLLPGIEDDRDRCIERLEGALKERKGIGRAHVERDQAPPCLCLHYDPAQLTVEDVRRLAQRAGADIANRYHHEVILVEGMDCSDCALVVEHGISRVDGVLSASLNYAAETLHVEFDTHHTSRRAIERRISADVVQLDSSHRTSAPHPWTGARHGT